MLKVSEDLRINFHRLRSFPNRRRDNHPLHYAASAQWLNGEVLIMVLLGRRALGRQVRRKLQRAMYSVPGSHSFMSSSGYADPPVAPYLFIPGSFRRDDRLFEEESDDEDDSEMQRVRTLYEQDIIFDLSKAIRDHLERRRDGLVIQLRKARGSAAGATPHLVFRCRDEDIYDRIIHFIKYKRCPNLNQWLTQHSVAHAVVIEKTLQMNGISTGNSDYTVCTSQHYPHETYQYTRIHGSVLFTQRQELSETTICTLGGLIRIGSEFFSLTTGHSFDHKDLTQSGQKTINWPGEGSPSKTSIKQITTLQNNLSRAEDREYSLALTTANTDHGKQFLSSARLWRKSEGETSDWALLSLESLRSNKTEEVSATNPLKPLDIEVPFLKAVPPSWPGAVKSQGQLHVTIVAGVSGVQKGRLSKHQSLWFFADRNLRVYEISLEAPLDTGDSGSWVYHDNLVCGIVVGSLSARKRAYMLPISNVIEDICKCLGINSGASESSISQNQLPLTQVQNQPLLSPLNQESAIIPSAKIPSFDSGMYMIPARVLEEFQSALHGHTRTSVYNKPYVLIDRFFRDWLTESRIHDLLRLYWSETEFVDLPLPAAVISRLYRKVLCILASISEISSIEYFATQLRISDQTLPIQLDDLRDRLHLEGMTETRLETLAFAFFEAQWQFCAPTIHFEDRRRYVVHEALPIKKMDIIGQGGFGSLYEIEVIEDFVSDELKKRATGAKHVCEGDKCYRFALKTFSPQHFHAFDAELSAFAALRSRSGLVQCLSSFSQEIITNEGGSISVHNILLEYCDLDLHTYFSTVRPPFIHQEVREFWKALVDIASALDQIHNLVTKENKKQFKGWHADVKPENILLVGNKFKLSDLGFARFIQTETEAVNMRIEGGTKQYAAPEVASHEYATQAIDIWSLGCVFSVAATWVVGGASSIRDYRQIREKAEELHSRSSLSVAGRFHDGENILPEVKEWHKLVRRSARKSDNITARVLDVVETRMLLSIADGRSSIATIVELLTKIVDDPTENIDDRPSSLITQVLSELDRSAMDEDDKSIVSRTSPALPDLQALFEQEKTPTGRVHHKFRLTNLAEHQSALEPLGRQGKLSRESHGQIHNNIKMPDLSTELLYSPQSVRRRFLFDAKDQLNVFDCFEARKELEKRARKGPFPWHFRRNSDGALGHHLRNRDLVFLVDNAHTMRAHWAQADLVLGTLVSLCSGLDNETSIDLEFTHSAQQVHCQRGWRKPQNKISQLMRSSVILPSRRDSTDMESILSRKLQDYLASHAVAVKNRSKPRYRTYIVLTDGSWAGMANERRLKEVLASFAKRQEHESSTGNSQRPVSIEFIQFGRDPQARALLQYLDDDLPYEKNCPDVIDTEYADGDVYKMILGSISEMWDQLDSQEPSRRPSQAGYF